MANSKAPNLRALRAYEQARADGWSLEEAQALLEPVKRVRPERETMDYLKDLHRLLGAAGRRVADADGPELAALLELADVLDEATTVAVAGQLTRGSWAYVGSGVGVSRQAAQQRWGKKVAELAAA